MPRRGENIFRRKDKRWEGRYAAGKNAEGKTVYKSVYGKTYTQVKEKLLYEKEKQAKKSYSKQNSYLFSDLAFKWLENKKQTVKASTLARYRNMIEKHLVPFFGSKDCTEIDEKIIQSFISGRSSHGNLKTNKGLSNKFLKDLLSVLKMILESADADPIKIGELILPAGK